MSIDSQLICSDGSVLDLTLLLCLADRLNDSRAHLRGCVDQINAGLYTGMPLDGDVIDLGANVGLFSAYASPTAGRVFAVEPSRRHFSVLKQLREEAYLDNVTCLNGAIWDRDGFVQVHQERDVLEMDRIAYDSPGGDVPCWTMRTLMEANGIDRARAVKMDVEGAEEEILASPEFAEVAHRIDAIWVECHNFRRWEDGNVLADRIAALVRKHFPSVRRPIRDLLIGTRL